MKSARRPGSSMFIAALLQIVGKLRRVAHNIAEEVLRVALQGLKFGVFFTGEIGLGSHRGAEERTEAQQFVDAECAAGLPGTPTTLPLGIFTVLWTLARVPTLWRSAAAGSSIRGSNWATNAQKRIVARERVYEGERALTAYGERQNRPREENGIPDGQDCESIWNEMFFYQPCFPLTRSGRKNRFGRIRCKRSGKGCPTCKSLQQKILVSNTQILA